MELLQPAWRKFKRTHAAALRQLRKSYRFEESAIQSYCRADGFDLDREARLEWIAHVRVLLGEDVRMEWIGSADHPACLVNHVMMFS